MRSSVNIVIVLMIVTISGQMPALMTDPILAECGVTSMLCVGVLWMKVTFGFTTTQLPKWSCS